MNKLYEMKYYKYKAKLEKLKELKGLKGGSSNISQDIVDREIQDREMWSQPDNDLSILIQKYISGKKSIKDIIYFISNLLEMNSRILVEDLSKPLKNSVYFGNYHSQYLEDLRPCHGGPPGRQYACTRHRGEGYPCSAPQEYVEYRDMEDRIEDERNSFIESALKKIIIYKKTGYFYPQYQNLYSDIQLDTNLSFLCKILPNEIVIQILENFCSTEINSSNIKKSVIFNQDFSHELLGTLMRAGLTFDENDLETAVQVGNLNAVKVLCRFTRINITSEILSKAVDSNIPEILEHLIQILYKSGNHNNIISMKSIANAFRNNSLELLKILLRYSDLRSLGFQRDVFSELILKDWCRVEPDRTNYDNSELVLFLIKEKFMEIDFRINLKTSGRPDAYTRIKTLDPNIKNILLYYSNVTNKSQMRPEYSSQYSDTEFKRIVEAREREMMRYSNEVLWEDRKDFAVFRESLINHFNQPKPTKSEDVAIDTRSRQPSLAEHVLYNIRFARHIASNLGDIDINTLYTFVLPNGKTLLSSIDYVL